jgi:CheY-like chemotaxis protein
MLETPPKKILVVDDEEDILTSLSQFLKRFQYQVFSTTKATEALALAKTMKPDLAILDVMMPEMGGEEIAANLSQDPDTASIPIIFLTGLLKKNEEPTSKKTGKHYILAKPTTGKELLGLVDKILSPQ